MHDTVGPKESWFSSIVKFVVVMNRNDQPDFGSHFFVDFYIQRIKQTWKEIVALSLTELHIMRFSCFIQYDQSVNRNNKRSLIHYFSAYHVTDQISKQSFLITYIDKSILNNQNQTQRKEIMFVLIDCHRIHTSYCCNVILANKMKHNQQINCIYSGLGSNIPPTI